MKIWPPHFLGQWLARVVATGDDDNGEDDGNSTLTAMDPAHTRAKQRQQGGNAVQATHGQ